MSQSGKGDDPPHQRPNEPDDAPLDGFLDLMRKYYPQYCCSGFIDSTLQRIREGDLQIQPELKHFFEELSGEVYYQWGMGHLPRSIGEGSLVVSIAQYPRKKTQLNFLLLDRVQEFYGMLLEANLRKAQEGVRWVFRGDRRLRCEKCKLIQDIAVWRKIEEELSLTETFSQSI
jgi:hypothetical protein